MTDLVPVHAYVGGPLVVVLVLTDAAGARSDDLIEALAGKPQVSEAAVSVRSTSRPVVVGGVVLGVVVAVVIMRARRSGACRIQATPDVSDVVARVTRVMDDGGIPVTVGQVLDVFDGSVLLIPESTLSALTAEARSAFASAAERTTGAVVFIVPDVVFTADL